MSQPVTVAPALAAIRASCLLFILSGIVKQAPDTQPPRTSQHLVNHRHNSRVDIFDLTVALSLPEFGCVFESFGYGILKALVTDIDWMVRLTSLFGWMTPGELKHFPMAERDAAVAWAAADD